MVTWVCNLNSSINRRFCRYTSIYFIVEIQWSHERENICITIKRCQRRDWRRKSKRKNQIVKCHQVSHALLCTFVIFLLHFVFQGTCLCVPPRAQITRVWIEQGFTCWHSSSQSTASARVVATVPFLKFLVILLTSKSGFVRKSDVKNM